IPVETMWGDDGIVLRLPEAIDRLPIEELMIDPDELTEVLVNAVPQTSLFAARFRECAARALLLPRRRPDQRTPLWQQRQKAADLLAVAAKYPTFPILLETSRECLQDVFDVPALRDILTQMRSRAIRLVNPDALTGDSTRQCRHTEGITVCSELALQLDCRLHVRRRRATRRTSCCRPRT
ncbi:MAG: hypothetical protein RLZZ332_1351, partial [Actinomycetota bacterium]